MRLRTTGGHTNENIFPFAIYHSVSRLLSALRPPPPRVTLCVFGSATLFHASVYFITFRWMLFPHSRTLSLPVPTLAMFLRVWNTFSFGLFRFTIAIYRIFFLYFLFIYENGNSHIDDRHFSNDAKAKEKRKR